MRYTLFREVHVWVHVLPRKVVHLVRTELRLSGTKWAKMKQETYDLQLILSVRLVRVPSGVPEQKPCSTTAARLFLCPVALFSLEFSLERYILIQAKLT